MKHSLMAACSTAVLLFATAAANAATLGQANGEAGAGQPAKLVICLNGLTAGKVSRAEIQQALKGKTGAGAVQLRNILTKNPTTNEWTLVEQMAAGGQGEAGNSRSAGVSSAALRQAVSPADGGKVPPCFDLTPNPPSS